MLMMEISSIILLTMGETPITFISTGHNGQPQGTWRETMDNHKENDPLIIISEQGYAAGMRALDRHERAVAKRTVTLAPCQYREIDPSTFGTSGAAQAVAL